MWKGGGGDWDRPGGQEVFCVSVTAHASPSQALQPRVTVSFFDQFAPKLWNVFALSGISLEWELALGPAFRRRCPHQAERLSSGGMKSDWWGAAPSASYLLLCPLLSVFQSNVSHILTCVYLQSVICGIYLVVNSHPLTGCLSSKLLFWGWFSCLERIKVSLCTRKST